MANRGTSMTMRTVVYGDILENSKAIQNLKSDTPDPSESIIWRDEPLPFSSDGIRSVVFVDLDSPFFSSDDFLLSIAASNDDITIVGKMAAPDIDQTIRFSRLGVAEILTPDQCLKRLTAQIEETGEKDIDETVPILANKYGIDVLIGKSSKMEEIRKTLIVLSEVDFPSALILGETGTGKSLVAKILHNAGLRSIHNLVEVNCSAIPDELFESELFGHVKGAFTDARKDKKGLFEYAQEGTLFLDEVGNLSPSAQAKLLKALEDKKFRRVGALAEETINVRVIAATNLHLKDAISAGKFREDLYYRLNLLTIEIPPLRERPDDIQDLVEHFLEYYSSIYKKPRVGIAASALDKMRLHQWPGNTRELCNVIERAVLLAKGKYIRDNDIGAAFNSNRVNLADRQQITIDVPPQGVTLREIEKRVVKHVLDMCEWNKSEAAKFLGISRARLRRILEDAGLNQNRRQNRS
ncbi:MAG: sigma-54 dependent transcriptional regulator [Candidatus Zixiibacteriota bacterium]